MDLASPAPSSAAPYRTLRPAPDEFDAFYAGYVARVPDGDLVAILARSGEDAAELLAGLTDEQAERAYAPGKWSIKEVVLHCADAERIFAYRVLRIGRGDQTSLPGWDEQAYAPASRANQRSIASLVEELRTVRAATVTLFDGLPADAWERRGNANGREITLRAVAWITAGHLLHHMAVIRERYL